MQEKDELKVMMEELIEQVSQDSMKGIARFLQANPYSGFEYYNFKVLKDKANLFEKTLYYESSLSKLYKEQICDILEEPHGKNTFFLVGYQGCGKSTFIHSVINLYSQKVETKVVLVDCDKAGMDTHQIKKVICKLLKKTVKKSANFSDFVDFYNDNLDVIEEFNDDKFEAFYELIKKFNEDGYTPEQCNEFNRLSKFINSELSIQEVFYLLVFWNLAVNYSDKEKTNEKLMIFIDNLDCIDEYNELSEFISCIDALTVDFSDVFEKFRLCRDNDDSDTFVSKIKIFIAMRETTKANLPSSHYSDAFKSIYTYKDMTEWYDKGEIIKRRINKLLEFDQNRKICEAQYGQLKLFLQVADDIYTRNVIYPLFNNNYRSAVDILVDIVTSHTSQMGIYAKLIGYKKDRYRHGARGVLYKCIFDEFNKGDGNEESCFKRIGVLDLLNRKNNSVSICRLILSYLSNYTETKCDSGRNSIALKEIINAFKGVFPDEQVIKTLCEMFALRDSKWSHLVSFNQIEYKDTEQRIESHIDIKELNTDRTMLHYSCAGKIYVEYVATHFEFFTARIFKEQVEALFCDSNLQIDTSTKNYKCCDVIDRVRSEVESCCNSLRAFNIKLCNDNNYLDPYITSNIYKDSHYVCMFKRIEYDGNERRFKQFHEERILLTHINYIDCYRLYVLNHCNQINHEQKVDLNKKLTECIEKYVALLESESVLKNPYTNRDFVDYYKKQIERLRNNWEDFETEISKNN